MPLLIAVFVALSLSATTYSSPTYDYVIVGGGTSGLVIANRLSENPAITVAVIEAGGSVFNNPDVTSPSGYGSAFGTAIDWAFSSTAQSFAGGKKQILRAGKCIGGTSAINGMAYTRAQNAQIDNWEKIGNPGWNWSNLFPYYLKSETIEQPTASQKANGASINPAYHGTSGPLKVGFSTVGTGNPLLGSTMKNLKVSTVADVNGGLMHGFTTDLQTIDTTLNIREDAARAYYWPITTRPNLHMYSSTLANNIIFPPNLTDSALATGINITSPTTTHSTISFSKEIILSAETLRTPLLLEHSGIGSPSILSTAGIAPLINLPPPPPSTIIYPTALDIFGSSLPTIKADLLSNLTSYATTTSALSHNNTKAAHLLNLYNLQFDLLFDSHTPMAEILLYTHNINVQYWPLLPFSRGSIHISSSDPSVQPNINPNYFALEFDIRAQSAISKYVRKILKTAPLSSYVGVEVTPGLSKVPTDANEDVWFTWIKNTYRPNFHVVGSAAMKPRDVGGVVDSDLKVYGTRNVRVVDASVWPTQVCGHLMSTLYAVAERAADLIKAAQ